MKRRTLCCLAPFTVVAVMAVCALAQNAGAASNAPSAASKPESADAHITNVYAITEVFADGPKVTAVSVKYDKNIRDSSLSPSTYTVKTDVAGQKIIKVYTSADGQKSTRRGINGRYVVLELSTDFTIPVGESTKFQAPSAASLKEGTQVDLTQNPEVITKVGSLSWDPSDHRSNLKSSNHGGEGKVVYVMQVGNITAADGTTITGSSSAKDNVYCWNLIVDGFLKPEFNGSNHSKIKYNIRFPRDYDPDKKYPVILFLANSDPQTSTHVSVLVQGLGGVIWSQKDEEARHEAIVVVPGFRNGLVDENDEMIKEVNGPPPSGHGGSGEGGAGSPASGLIAPGGTPQGQAVPNGPSYPYLANFEMMDWLLEQFPSMDRSRIYLTAQGDNARAAIKMLIDRPDMFAAALLFSPDYDPAKILKLPKTNVWIVSSEGDDKTYPKMKAAIENLQAAGVGVSTAVWNGRSSAGRFASDVGGMIEEGKHIKFTVLKKGTVLPPGVPDDAADNHAYTWRIGYSIQGLRDWLFTQKK